MTLTACAGMQVTALICDLCTQSGAAGEAGLGSITQFAHVYSHAPGALRFLCEYLQMTWKSSPRLEGSASEGQRDAEEQLVYHQLLHLYLSDLLNQYAPACVNSTC